MQTFNVSMDALQTSAARAQDPRKRRIASTRRL